MVLSSDFIVNEKKIMKKDTKKRKKRLSRKRKEAESLE